MSDLLPADVLTISVIGYIHGQDAELGAASYQVNPDAPGLDHGPSHAAMLGWLRIHAARDLRLVTDVLVTDRHGRVLVPWTRPSSPRLFLELLGLDG